MTTKRLKGKDGVGGIKIKLSGYPASKMKEITSLLDQHNYEETTPEEYRKATKKALDSDKGYQPENED